MNTISAPPHSPVFLEDVLKIFRGITVPVHRAFDGTFGRGGHVRAVLENWPAANIIAFDWDEDAIAAGQIGLAAEIAQGRLRLLHANFRDLGELRTADPDLGKPFQLMLLDLGVSSPQLDHGERGFSFYHDGPLDMRMDRRSETTAAEIINQWDEQDLAKLFIEYGEIQRPFRVVRAIVHDRQHRKSFVSTKELAGLIERVDGWQKKGSHPATRYFMALRLRVNDELDGLERALPNLIASLAPGGIFAVISFHSLEDRIVKNVFKSHLNEGSLVNKKVIKPSDEEVKRNPRARSAKLRAFIKHKPDDRSVL